MYPAKNLTAALLAVRPLLQTARRGGRAAAATARAMSEMKLVATIASTRFKFSETVKISSELGFQSEHASRFIPNFKAMTGRLKGLRLCHGTHAE